MVQVWLKFITCLLTNWADFSVSFFCSDHFPSRFSLVLTCITRQFLVTQGLRLRASCSISETIAFEWVGSFTWKLKIQECHKSREISYSLFRKFSIYENFVHGMHQSFAAKFLKMSFPSFSFLIVDLIRKQSILSCSFCYQWLRCENELKKQVIQLPYANSCLKCSGSVNRSQTFNLKFGWGELCNFMRKPLRKAIN